MELIENLKKEYSNQNEFNKNDLFERLGVY